MRAISVAVALLLAGACAKKQTVTPPPPPHRPRARPQPKQQSQHVDPRRTDCDPVVVDEQPPAMKYADRSIEEAENLAKQGLSVLLESEDRQRPVPERQLRLTKAVDFFMTALAADPYNVNATYNLAAAYARIKRNQCALNMLGRLLLLRALPSHAAAVNLKIDRLLGRGKWKGNLDPDFYDMRDNPGFRELVKNF